MTARVKSNALQPMAAKPDGSAPPTGIRSSATPVLVVMEAAGGVRAGSALRSALNARAEVRVVSQSDLVRKSQSPAAVITVAAVTSQIVSVAYWDMTGARDWLSSPAPAQADQLDAVVLALASALLDRHRGDLVESGRRAVGANEFSRNASAVYAMLGRFAKIGPRTNVSLRYEDF